MGLVSGTTGNNAGSNAASNLSKSAAAAVITTSITKVSNNNSSSNKANIKDDANSTPKSEVLLSQLLNNGNALTAQQFASQNENAKWQAIARETQLAPFKYQAAAANAQIAGSVISGGLSAAGNLLSGLGGGKKKAKNKGNRGGDEDGDGGTESSSVARGAQGGGCANGQCGRTSSSSSSASTSDRTVSQVAQVDSVWNVAGANRPESTEKFRQTESTNQNQESFSQRELITQSKEEAAEVREEQRIEIAREETERETQAV